LLTPRPPRPLPAPPRSLECRLRHYWGLKVRGQHTGTTSRGRLAATLQAAQQAGGKQAVRAEK